MRDYEEFLKVDDFLNINAAYMGWKKISDGVFERGGVRMKISKCRKQLQVVTFMKHPKWGDTALVRSDISRDEMKRIFKDPRHHTGKGYVLNKNKIP